MSSDLLNIGENEVAVSGQFDPPDDNFGLESLDSLKPGKLVLIQATTVDMKGARPGQLLDTISEEAYDALPVVIIDRGVKRVLYPPGGELGAKPLCRSNDGIVPAPRALSPQARHCKTCPKAQWLSGMPSECNKNIELLVVSKETGLPYYLTVTGRSVTSYNHFMEKLTHDMVKRKNKGESPSLCDYVFDISSTREPTKKGSTYVMRFLKVQRLPDSTDFRSMRQTFLKHRTDAAAAREAQAVEEVVDEAIDAEIIYQDV